MSSSDSTSDDSDCDEGYTKLREVGPGEKKRNAHVMVRYLRMMDRAAAINNLNVGPNANLPALSEHGVDSGTINKVFASRWLNEHQVVIGTKCNQLIIVDVTNNNKTFISMISGYSAGEPLHANCAIRSIDISPCGSMLATSAENSRCLAVYNLPSFTHCQTGVGGHTDVIFDVKWINRVSCVTGARDDRLTLWRIPEHQDDEMVLGFFNNLAPHISVKVPDANIIRALAFNQEAQEMGIASTNGRLYTWDIATFQKKATDTRLLNFGDIVCMSYSSQLQLYAVGSTGTVHFLDVDLIQILAIPIPMDADGESRVCRSLSFNGNIVTIGTSDSCLLFYDINAANYLQTEGWNDVVLHASEGYMANDDEFEDVAAQGLVDQAIFTHCYNESRTKLFTAGGPMLSSLKGNYVAVWQ